MNKAERQSLAAIPLILAVAGGIAWAGSQGSTQAFGVPLFALCGALAFVVNWVAFIPAYRFQSERYYDLTGSITYGCIVVTAVVAGPGHPRSWLLATLVAVWAIRLGSFLFARISRDGSDGRFDVLKPSLPRFFMTWTLQGLWVFVTLSCALAAMTSASQSPLGPLAWVGLLVWLLGFCVEVVADRQKQRFRADPANRGRFIQSGVWAWSRHPNYFGEITLWFGVALVALPALSSWQLVTLVSPVFVYVLLTRISGIPMLESRGKRKWGEDPEYKAYKQRTPVLWPRPPRAQPRQPLDRSA